MTIFKKSGRMWLTIILSLIVLMAFMYSMAALVVRSNAAEAKSDSRYVKVLADIHAQNLDNQKVEDFLSAEQEFSAKDLAEFVIGMILFFAFYTLIFRCFARALLGEWKGPWIS